jgi:hypothetical protein
MSKRRRRAKNRTWLRRLFRKEKPTIDQGPISPMLLREGAAEGGLDQKDFDKLTSQRRKRPWWQRLLFSSRRRKHKTPTPLFIKPIEPEAPREKLRLNRSIMLAINSTILYLLAYVLVYLLYQLTVIYTANRFGISGVLYYFDVFWPIGDSSPLWYPYFKIVLITGSGPFISLIAGLLFFRIYIPKARNPVTKLFFLWIALHALNMFFGAFVAGVTTNDGFGYVPLWLYMNIVFRIVFSFISLFALAVFGYYAARYFLETALAPSFLKAEKRSQFLLYQAIIPGILGAVILFLIRIPNNPPYHIIMLFTFFAATITAYFNHKAKPDRIRSFPKHQGRKFQLTYFIIAVALLAAFRIILAYGLHIIIKFSMTVSFFSE